MTTPLPILPQIIAEAGLVSASPVQPGTVLVLDDVTLGKLDTGTLGGDITWTDLSAGFTQRVISFTITRPSSRLEGPLWQYQAATASILLDNSDGALDPDNLAGPYVTAGATELVPMVPVRVRAIFSGTAYSLYSGHADGWMPAQVTYLGGYAELTLPATDGFKILAGLTLPPAAAAGAGETTGARIGRILNAAGWYTGSAWRTIATGKSTVQAYTAGDTPLNLMQVTSDSEIGQLYVDGTGRVVFRDRQQILTDARSASVQAVFGDLPGTSHTAGTELACAAVSRASDDTAIANDIQATRTGGTLQEVQDAASESKYKFPRTYQRSDLILQNDSDALNWAQWVLYVAKDNPDRFDTLAVDPQADPLNLWPQVLSREIGDRIQIWHRPASVAAFSKDCFITGITHQWDSVSSAWLTTWALQDASKYGSFLVLDDPVLGKLDSNAVSYLRIARSIFPPGFVFSCPRLAADIPALDAVGPSCISTRLPVAAVKLIRMPLRACGAPRVADRQCPPDVDAVRYRLAVVRVAAPAVLADDVIQCHPIGDRTDLGGIKQPVNDPHLALVHDLRASCAGMAFAPAPA